MPDMNAKTLGLSLERLHRLSETLRSRVEENIIPGVVIAIGRRGRLALLEAIGFRDRENQAVMNVDSIFRIASMTKPLISLAAMMLVEENKISLESPISDYLPVLKNVRVGQETATGLKLVPAEREPTVRDLLRHTSGFTHDLYGDRPVKHLYRDARLRSVGSTAEFLAKLAELPLQAQPGSEWSYGFSTDLVGHIVEAVSAMTLDEFITKNVARPLGMRNTTFVVSAEDKDRLAQPQADVVTGERPQMLDPSIRPSRYGSGGLVSTCGDYARFCQFWLNRGVLDGVRLITEKTVEQMTRDQLTSNVRADPDVYAQFGRATPVSTFGSGFGLGFSVRTQKGRTPWRGSIGDFWWMGSSGCVFWIDPVKELFGILLSQAPNQLMDHLLLMREAVYQALID
jgi:CubicO group peptidase (beta-lactamase class C family)